MRFSTQSIQALLLISPFITTLPPANSFTFPLYHRATTDSEASHRALHEAEDLSTLFQGLGTHYVDVWLGQPPQRQTVIVDTGSSVTAVPAVGCQDCGDKHTDAFYNFSKSETFRKLGCDECELGSCQKKEVEGKEIEYCFLSMSYLEGSSWSAFEAEEHLYVGGPHDSPEEDRPTFKFNLGMQLSTKGKFKDQLSNGIAGMMNHPGSLWRQLYDDKMIDKQKFSLCMLNGNDADIKGSVAGTMTLGDFNENLKKESFWKTPMVYAQMNSSGMFSVSLRAIHILRGDGTSASRLNAGVEDVSPNLESVRKIDLDSELLENKQNVVDSGTTSTYLDNKFRMPMKGVFKELVGVDIIHETEENVPFELTDEQLAKMPTVVFQLKGAEGERANTNYDPQTTSGLAGNLDKENPHDVLVTMSPLHYLVATRENGKTQLQFRIHFNDNANAIILLGANFMKGHDVVFDVDNNAMGFAESDCNYDAYSSQLMALNEGKPNGGDKQK